MEQTLEPITEIDIMAGVVRSQEPNMSLEVARLILSWQFDDASGVGVIFVGENRSRGAAPVSVPLIVVTAVQGT